MFVYGVNVVIHMTSDFFGYDIEDFFDRQPKWKQVFLKPTIYCNVCMSSFWGTIAYWFLLGESDPYFWVICCVCSAGIISIINNLKQ